MRDDLHLSPEDLRAAARRLAAPPLEGLARPIEPGYTWGDIVLAAGGLSQLQELWARARHQVRILEEWGHGRKCVRLPGLTAHFSGPPAFRAAR